MKHIITVRRDASGNITVNGLVYQHDHGHIIQLEGFMLPEEWYLDLANSELGKCITMRGCKNQTSLPDNLLLSGNNVHCWVVNQTQSERLTQCHFVVPVIRRAELPES